MGNFAKGKYSNYGTLEIKATGDVYTGEWNKGIIYRGTWTKKDGSRYEGTFWKKMADGRGVWTKDGDTYSGDFVKNKFEGQGTYTKKNGSTRKGKWQGGQLIQEDRYQGTSRRKRYMGYTQYNMNYNP